jgi:hypothetical protein
MPNGPFLPSDFTATKFSTVADKAEFGNTLLRFIESDWASALFTKRFYNRLSMCFLHIAHYNRTQFYEEWFSSLAAQVRFLRLEWTPKMRQANKTHFSANGELCHGSESTEVHAGV